MRDGLKEIVDRELSGLRWQPRNRNAVLARTKGEPKMKKRLSAGLILAVVLTLAAVSALAVYALTRSPEAEAIYRPGSRNGRLRADGGNHGPVSWRSMRKRTAAGA